MRAMLSLLAARAEQVVSRNEIIDGLWGDTAPASVDSAIYTYVSSLRRVLEPDRTRRSDPTVLASVGSGYSLRIDRDDIDAHRFETSVDSAYRMEANGALTELDRALALWEGEPLDGIACPFADAYRLHLLDLRLAAQQKRAELMLDAGLAEQAVPDLDKLVREHPAREDIRALFMTALYQLDRRDEALATFAQARSHLVEELGIEPGAGLTSLYERIRSDDGLPPPRQSTEVTVARPMLVGRATETRPVLDAMERLRGGRGGCVWLDGEPGIGKTALLTSATDVAGIRVLSATGDELGHRFAFRLILRCLGVSATATDPRCVAVARDLDALHNVPSPGSASDAELVAVDRLVDLVDQLCADQPLALVIDDVHWADEASVLVLHRLVRLTGQRPLLLLCASRLVHGERLCIRLRRAFTAAGGDHITLGPLSPDDAAELASGIAGTEGMGLGRAITLAGGNPYYLEEVVRCLLDDPTWAGVPGEKIARDTPVRLPQSLTSSLTRHLDTLSPGTVEVLRHASLLGAEFSIKEAALVMSRPMSTLMEAIEEACAVGLLTSAGVNLAFRHPIIQLCLRESTPSSVREAMHHDAATVLLRMGAPPHKIASHLVATTTVPDVTVVPWLMENAEKLLESSAELLSELLTRLLASATLDGGERESFTLVLARALFQLGRPAGDAAQQVLARTHDAGLTVEMLWVLAQERHHDGDLDAATGIIAEAFDEADKSPFWQALLHAKKATIAADAGDLLSALDSAASALQHAADDRATVFAEHAMWRVRTVQRDHLASLSHIERAFAAADRLGDANHLRAGLVESHRFSLLNLERDPGAADVVHDYRTGRWRRVLDFADTPSGSLELRSPGFALTPHAVASIISARSNDHAAASRHLTIATTRGQDAAARMEHHGIPTVALALVHELGGDKDEALTTLRSLLHQEETPVARAQWLPLVLRLALELGAADVSRRVLELCDLEASKEVLPAGAFVARARCRGLVNRDAALLRTAIDHCQDAGLWLEAAEATEDIAVVLAEIDEPRMAMAALHQAISAYEKLGATWDVSRARARVQKAAAGPAGAGPHTAGTPTDDSSPAR
ncbi:BTAD domain-containing putative transcriptional regulator [Lentzea sp. NBRC 102530]|uniref:BTAD domain-containing putative transcriptional regulator n=1 Tax=Lentzea sp. NBRC 102530 TaxID=3032201 RepID=UPI002552AF06|nr:BTAD domain-containing putative transcriptional regulator [Lentzea sp. NBRC 102530]